MGAIYLSLHSGQGLNLYLAEAKFGPTDVQRASF